MNRSAATPDVLEVGAEMPVHEYRIRRADLIAYAGASGDMNPIHWSDSAAEQAGLPGVIAHGMLTMARSAAAVTSWLGKTAQVEEYGVRFVSPIAVTGEDALVRVQATVVDRTEPGRVTVELTATHDGRQVLGRARMIAVLP